MSYSRIVGVRSPAARTDLTVVLDLDSCLLHTMPSGTTDLLTKIMTDPNLLEIRSRVYQMSIYDLGGKKGHGAAEKYWGVFRPHLLTFMMFLFSYCRTVCFWSAGQRDYVNECVAKICRGMRTPYIVMNWDDIEELPDGGYHKPLSKVIALDPENIKEDRILLIDDRRQNGISAPSSFILIPRYEPTPNTSALMQDDIALLQIKQWLLSDAVTRARDIRMVDKSRIFLTSLAPSPPARSQIYIEPRSAMWANPLYLQSLPDDGLISVTI